MKPRRKTSRDYYSRDIERDSGYTPDLIANPILYPVGYFVDQNRLWIKMSDARYRLATYNELVLWLNDELKLPRALDRR